MVATRGLNLDWPMKQRRSPDTGALRAKACGPPQGGVHIATKRPGMNHPGSLTTINSNCEKRADPLISECTLSCPMGSPIDCIPPSPERLFGLMRRRNLKYHNNKIFNTTIWATTT